MYIIVDHALYVVACRRFAMARISDNVPAGNKAKRFSSINHTAKTISLYHHHIFCSTLLASGYDPRSIQDGALCGKSQQLKVNAILLL